MSVLTSELRYAGVWNATSTYFRNDMVLSPINSKAYILVVNSLMGEADPSVASDNWTLNPSNKVVASINNLLNDVTLTTSDDLLHIATSSATNTITIEKAPNTFGTYIFANGDDPLIAVITIPSMTKTGLVSITYIRGSGKDPLSIKVIENDVDTCRVSLTTEMADGDSIIWQVLAFS